MRRRRLGSRGPELSVVGFGAWEAGGSEFLGPAPPRERRVEAVRAALDAGVNWIDTAEIYGRGTSEEVVGTVLRSRREEVVIATKVAPAPVGSGFRPSDVRRACAGSLKRLGTDRIDIYQLHWPDGSGIPLEDTWGAMSELVEEGLVGFLGVSNFDRTLTERCEAIRHVDSLQNEFSMLKLDDRELIAWCGDHGIGVLTYGPLGYGLLTGEITSQTTFHPLDFRSGHDAWGYWERLFAPGRLERSLAVVVGLRAIADRLGTTPSQIALAWNIAQPGVTAAIAGSRNPEHARSNAGAGDLVLDDPTLRELDALLSLGPAFA